MTNGPPAELALPTVLAGLQLVGAPLTSYQLAAAAAINEPGAELETYRHYKIVLLWPRQTGKTTLLAALALGRARTLRDYRAAYAAQNGMTTTKRFHEWTGALRPFAGRYHLRTSAGTERITARATGSYLMAFPAIPGRLRSTANDLIIVDEAQEHDDAALGQALDTSLIPTMHTRPRAQWIIAGTAGDLRSTYFRRHYLAARDTPGALLLELGTWPAGADPSDPATWAAYHPGLRAGRTTIERMQREHDALGPEQFAREYGNRWSEATTDTLFPPGAWIGCHDRLAGIAGPVTLALEVPPDREHAVIVAAGPSSTRPGALHVEMLPILPLPQAAAACARLTAEHRTRLWVDDHSHTVTHIARFRAARVPLHVAGSQDVMTASLALYDRIRERTLTHLDQPPLTAAVAAATRKNVGNRWTFDRTAPGGAVMMAAALATLAAERHHDTPDARLIHA